MTETKQPQQLYVLFFAEMWERFSYYGMRALLVLYMTKMVVEGGFGWADEKAYTIYGAYTGLVYATPFIGGIIADRVLGRKKAVTLAGILMALGHFLMAVPGMLAFYGALGLLIAGNGLFKPNISTIVGELYHEGDPRRDGGFTIFYMGINLGAFFAPLICGWLGETYGWHYGFGAAGVGMVLGQIVFSGYGKHLKDYGNPPDLAWLKKPKFAGLNPEILTYICAVLSVGLFAFLTNNEVQHPVIQWLMGGVGVAVVIAMMVMTKDKIERERMLVVLVLIFFSTMFWAFFEQAGSSINLFTERNVDRSIFGWVMPTSWGQAFNPFFILALGVPFSTLWVKLADKGREPSTPIKFMLGILQLGLGFLVLGMGARLGYSTGSVMILWLVLVYFLHTTGELCLSPVGLSMVTKLSPHRMVSMVMGAWFLSNAFANYGASLLAKLTAVGGEGAGAAVVDPMVTVRTYGEFFMKLGFTAVGVSVLLLLLVPVLKKWMNGIH